MSCGTPSAGRRPGRSAAQTDTSWLSASLSSATSAACPASRSAATSKRRPSQTEAAAAQALHLAAGAASARHFGDDALRLHRAAADAALRAGDKVSAARDLAQAAEFINRAFGLIADMPPAGAVDALLTEARALAGGDLAAEARIRTAEAFAGPEIDPATAEATEQALVLARRAGNPLAESAALDQLTAVQLARGEVRAAAASARRRTSLLAALPVRADTGLEVSDAYCMAADTATAAGDLPAARGLAERVRDLPFHREEGHLATARLLVVTALADWAETVALSQRYREGWSGQGGRRTVTLTAQRTQRRRCMACGGTTARVLHGSISAAA